MKNQDGGFNQCNDMVVFIERKKREEREEREGGKKEEGRRRKGGEKGRGREGERIYLSYSVRKAF